MALIIWQLELIANPALQWSFRGPHVAMAVARHKTGPGLEASLKGQPPPTTESASNSCSEIPTY